MFAKLAKCVLHSYHIKEMQRACTGPAALNIRIAVACCRLDRSRQWEAVCRDVVVLMMLVAEIRVYLSKRFYTVRKVSSSKTRATTILSFCSRSGENNIIYYLCLFITY